MVIRYTHAMKRKKSDYLDNPDTQIVFHKRMMKVWEYNAPVVVVAYACVFIFPRYSVTIIGAIGTYTALISLYANWVSDFGGLSAAQASKKVDGPVKSSDIISFS